MKWGCPPISLFFEKSGITIVDGAKHLPITAGVSCFLNTMNGGFLYIRCKADASISSKDFYEIYRMWCEENSLAPLKARSFSDAMIANAGRFNLEHCNNITNSAGRRVWGFMGVEAIARPHINGFYGDSPCTYVPEDIPEEWRQVE